MSVTDRQTDGRTDIHSESKCRAPLCCAAGYTDAMHSEVHLAHLSQNCPVAS